MTRSDRYEILRELGRDATGRLLLGRDDETGREVVVRTVDLLRGVDAEIRRTAVAAAERTAIPLRALGHPLLVPIEGCFELEGCPALVAQRVSGMPLAQVCVPEALLPIDDAVEIVAAVAEALADAGRAGVVHGGIRPSTLLRVDHDAVRVSDFGVGTMLASARVAGAIVERGAGYMPPESLRGGAVTESGDQFSLGAVLLELLGGAPAFPGDDLPSVVYRIVHEPPRGPDGLPRPIPRALWPPLRRALAKDPDQRFASGREFATALREALDQVADRERVGADSRGPQRTTSRGERTTDRRGSEPQRWPWVVAFALLAGVGLVLGLRGLPGASAAPPEVWVEARVRAVPEGATVTLDGAPLENGRARFRQAGPFGTLQAVLGCRNVEHALQPVDAGAEVVLELPPAALDWRVEPGARDARITVNGRSAGRTPADVSLDLCRANRIEVQAAGFLPAVVDIPAGATLPEARARLTSLALERIPRGKLVLPGLADARLVWFLDGKRVGGSGTEIEAEQGRHTLRYKNDYHWIEGALEIEVVAGDTLRPDLAVEFATLTVQAFPPNAKVYLRRPGGDWRFLDETPATRRVAAGDYEVKVELVTSGQSEIRDVTLEAGDEKPLRVSFGGT